MKKNEKEVIIAFQVNKRQLIDDMIRFIQKEAENVDITKDEDVTECFLKAFRWGVFNQIHGFDENELRSNILNWWIEYIDSRSSEWKRSEVETIPDIIYDEIELNTAIEEFLKRVLKWK